MAKTKQELFDTIYRGLAKQGWRQAANINSNGLLQCRYLTEDGCKCAIGQLIPDGHPAQSASLNVKGLVNMYKDLLDIWGVPNMLLLEQCQHDHDRNPAPSDMKRAFEQRAASESFTIPQV